MLALMMACDLVPGQIFLNLDMCHIFWSIDKLSTILCNDIEALAFDIIQYRLISSKLLTGPVLLKYEWMSKLVACL